MQVEVKNKISRVHYITQDIVGYSQAELAELACKGGADCVQLRVKDTPFEEWLAIAESVKKICDQYKAQLIINDNVEIALRIKAAGVHLGKTDMSPKEAREQLGENFIIGGTANNLEDIIALKETSVDYIGLGPFRFTTTKKNLSPVLGANGISKILEEAAVKVPVIAIGGIEIADIDLVMTTGVYGVAISSAVSMAADKPGAMSQFMLKLNTY